MDERDARLRSLEQNISHYQNMLKTRLSEVELRFVERRLAEERFAMRILDYIRPSASKRHHLPEALE
jgi:hypothetical protein